MNRPIEQLDESSIETSAVTPHRTRRALVVCDQWLGSNGYAGMKALRRAGWSVNVVAEWEYVPVRWRARGMRALGRLLRPHAVKEFNEALLESARRSSPELFLAFKGTFVDASSVRRLRDNGICAYCFYPDVSTRTHGPYIPECLPHYDIVFTTKQFAAKDLAELGVRRTVVVHHAFDPDLHRPLELTAEDHARYGCDVSFIGTWSPKKERLLAALCSALPTLKVRIWGAQWERSTSPALREAIAGFPIEGEEYVRAIRASAINLGLLSERREGASDGDQVTSRTFHIPASGGFMLHERTPELLSLFTENENVAAFDGAEQLVESVRHWLSRPDDRWRIAASGQAVVSSGHSWDVRIRELLMHHQPARRS